MSESEDEDHAYYGSPLEPLDEENIPKKKPVLIQDQIATDQYGKRRFHGAFTGGFSAGFFNSVGTLEGWVPSKFKSSRDSKAGSISQRPEDFMDEEDTDVFGIAPTQLRAKPEYGGSKTAKRKMEISDGPIPGDPVLKNILEPASITIGMKLLMRLGWKPGQGIGPMLTWAEKMGDEADPEELGLKPDVLFPPTPVQEHFIKAKSDKFGLGYVGLSKEPVLNQRFTLFDNPLKLKENKKKLSIRGQAFGVGAFEEEDEDIYAKDDMSRYDFALETSATLRDARRKERLKEKEQLAICESFDCLEGFEPSQNKLNRKKFFPPPDLPADFDPNAIQKKSRFDPVIRGNPDAIKGKHIINATDRAAILGEPTIQTESQPSDSSDNFNGNQVIDLPNEIHDSSFRPFVSDPQKQGRYERYLGFIRIGATDALKNIQPVEMSDWEKEREAKEFEQAAKLYRPLSGLMDDKFSRGGLLDDSADPLAAVAKSQPAAVEEWVTAAKEKKFGKLTRSVSDWDPVPLLCKRMNIPEPRNSDIALAKIAEEANKRKPKFSAFDFLDTAKGAGVEVHEKEVSLSTPENSRSVDDLPGVNAVERKEKMSLPEPLLDPKIVEAEDPKEKMDLFKAIFASSDEESDSEDSNKVDGGKDKLLEMDKVETKSQNKNVLRNTSPPRGIFANLDLDALKPKPLPIKENEEKVEESTKHNKTQDAEILNTSSEPLDPSLLYGPSLPSKPVFIPKAKSVKDSETSSSSEDEWVERKKEKAKKKKHSKKHKKEKKKDHHKHKKKKKR